MNKIYRNYADVRSQISDADVLLYRGDRWYERLIGIAGRSNYCHAGMAAWWHGRVHVLQETAFDDHKPLFSEVLRTFPGEIDVYGPYLGAFDRDLITKEMIEIVGQKYGWRNLAATIARHLPMLAGFVRPTLDDEAKSKYPPFCSAAVSRAFRVAGIDLVPNLSDDDTEPADLSRSGFLAYRFTIKSAKKTTKGI